MTVPAPIVLVHGACHGPWCWERVTPLLEAAGHTVTAVELPGRGASGAPGWWRWSLTDYAAAVVRSAEQAARPVIAVGHSMGGQVISAAAEVAPERFARLVYLAAFLAIDGDSIASLSTLDKHSDIATATNLSWLKGQLTIDPATARPVFYGDCGDADVAWASARLAPEPIRPSLAKLRLGERFQAIPRSYVRCTADRALSIQFQDAMIARQPCQRVASLDASHSPFLSMPDRLAATLQSVI